MKEKDKYSLEIGSEVFLDRKTYKNKFKPVMSKEQKEEYKKFQKQNYNIDNDEEENEAYM